jgi:glycosyltransferase involved in cell wall biosynthesis
VKRTLPYMSVVCALYNDADTVAATLDSLLAQDYPRDRYEIIVVEDGSTDNSYEIASRYPVKIIRHEKNLGCSAARQTGLEHARGDIYVCFDTDCVAQPGWLSALARGYAELGYVASGIGSVLIPPHVTKNVVDRFMLATDSGQAPTLDLDLAQHPLRRFMAYVRDQLKRGREAAAKSPYPVSQLNSATSSFPIWVLRAVGGWDPTMRWMEDSYISELIKQRFNDRLFYALPDAQIIHDAGLSLVDFVRRPFSRGLSNLKYYRRNGVTPPMYPFPILWLGATMASVLAGPVTVVAVALILPQCLYFWWPVRAGRECQLRHLVFPYLQLAEELSTVAGLVRGFMLMRMEVPHA